MTPPLINITLPVYNEEAQLAENAHRVLAFLAGQPASRWEILIADNGSTDRTWAIAQELAADVGSATSAAVSRRALHLDAPGRGGALKTAWLASKADILSYMDLDLSADLACLPALLAAITEGGADLAAGSRLLPPHRRRGAGGARC
jgi:glycosyltransferase involved in cell wall biosynthesis